MSMTDNLTHALRYAALGWAVMPLHAVINGRCDCNKDTCASPGKHPRTMRGLKDASTDADTVRKWWGMWPNANIGVATGTASGIIVIDVDDISAGGLDGKDLPPTVTQETGSGGVHYIYRHPGDRRVKSSVRVVPGADSRADGGYIVVPPSNHVKGDYRWTISPEDMAPADAPDWWLRLLEASKARTDVPQDGERIFAGGRNESLTSLAGTMRRVGLGYQAILSALQAHNLAACDPPLDDAEVVQIARSVSQYEIETQDERELREHGRMVAARMLKANDDAIARSLALDRKAVEGAGPPPENFVPREGLIRDVTDYIISGSIWPQPILATIAATALIASLAGRRYATETNLRTNLYFVGIAQSGSGKDSARKSIKRILAGLDGGLDILGGDRISSGPALLAALESYPTRLYLLDEFGEMLKSVTGQRSDGWRREIMTNLMQLYSDAGSIFNGTDYADRKNRKQVTIYDPCVVLYATTTPDSFYGALSSAEGTGGAMARMMVIEPGTGRTERRRSANTEPPPHDLLRKLDMVRQLGGAGNLSGVGQIDSSRPRVVKMTPSVSDAWYNLDVMLTEQMTTDTAASIYSRVAENAAKLALVYAIAKDTNAPLIDEEAFAWARDIALWSANLVMEQINLRVADTEAERNSKAIEAEIIKGKAKGKTKAELRNVLTKIRPYEQQSYLDTMMANGVIFEGKRATGGRPAVTYIAARYYDEYQAGAVSAEKQPGE